MTRSDDGDRHARRNYDAVATEYARLIPDLSIEASLDRAVLAACVEMDGAPAGRWPKRLRKGHLVAHLVSAGLDVVGLELSLGMVREVRRDLASR